MRTPRPFHRGPAGPSILRPTARTGAVLGRERRSDREGTFLDACSECGSKVSSLAENCPECGADLGRRKWFGGGGLLIASLILLAGALYLAGFYASPLLERFWVGRNGTITGAVEGNGEVDATRLDAYEVCQTFIEERLADQVGSNVATMKPFDERINEVTERKSARDFRVNSLRSYSVVGQQGVRDVLYDCEVHYGEDGEWELRRLDLRQR